jgi:hypothetical protein
MSRNDFTSNNNSSLFTAPEIKEKKFLLFFFFICRCRIHVYESDIYSVGNILGLLFDGWYVSGSSGGIISKERFENWMKLQEKMIEEVYI